MVNNFPSIIQAREIFENIISSRNSSDHPFTGTMEIEFREHCLNVAYIAQTIAAKTANLNPDIAYVMGLLHDGGKIIDEYAHKRYHGLVGYYLFTEKDQPELARINLTHAFYMKDFKPEDYPFPRDDMLRCQQLLRDIDYDDYDLIIQLSDMLNDMGKTCTLEYRMASVAKRRGIPSEKTHPILARLNIIKNYFDQKCGCDIYKLIGTSSI